MFPQEVAEAFKLSPLTWGDIIQEFLLPEAAVMLIMEDMNVLYEDAIDVLRDSRSFGNSMHPANEDHPAVCSLGQQAVSL
jgi:hypothetical protein